ncbi:acid protease [Punctularia strigosozonata HHB-11173 SS5]|uniref:acid protease n=1 Tax=Punctularia strigosozonata (strain HHB-11173) TaxID=741275 RepID=UPI0004416789|nr:acid protease [Punctularia strigosozonata HHB-11173 SS5]EIN09402.1 acid protease [Punctularia strigosozonata HHB-11173 SS5]
MLVSSLPVSLALILLLSLLDPISAAPRSRTRTAGQSIPLIRRNAVRSATDWGTWAKNHKLALEVKYGGSSSNRKRASGTNLLVNQNADSSYYGTIAVGTPATSYNVILDTGSSDLWLADSNCFLGCESIATFDTTSSSTFRNLSTTFDITYGSGRAAGSLAQDTIQMAGFSVSDQIFAVCDEVSSGLLNKPASGLMGLAWQTIASSGATPFWQQLAANSLWDEPVMAFQLTRFLNDSKAQTLEPGGSFTMGFTNSSLYTGEIEYQSIPSGAVSYWILPLTDITVQGNTVTLPSGSSSYSAIDTGTTLVGGPEDAIAAIFAQIPDAVAGTGDYAGYWMYPCDTDVTVQMSFGGRLWAIDPADFRLAQLSQNTCLGAFFALDTGSSAPSWIVGDTFLKNVYSVFRYNPPSVGFAELSDTALAAVSDSVPSATIGSIAASVEATTSAKSDKVQSSAPVATPSFALIASCLLIMIPPMAW